MLIKIISGTYGYRPTLPNGKRSPYLLPVNRDSQPIEVDAAEAKRLIELGVVEAVDAVNAPAEPQKGPEDAGTAYSVEMTQSELRAAMDAAGLPYDKRTTQKQMVEALTAAEDEAPSFEPEDVVD